MDEATLESVVNRSGFPLQIRADNLVTDTRSRHGWKVLYSEHGWQNQYDKASGFIDLVLENKDQSSLLVIECKRVLDSDWIFLQPSADNPHRRYCKAWVSYHKGRDARYFDWHEMATDPGSHESAFCVVHGEDNKSRPMLERVAASVVSSTEALAGEELHVKVRESLLLRIYFSVVLTTARLQVCTFDPAGISIADGTLDKSVFTEVPFVRFRKQLTNKPLRQDAVSTHVGTRSELVRAKDNTVFIVNAERLLEFLLAFETDVSALRYLQQPAL